MIPILASERDCLFVIVGDVNHGDPAAVQLSQQRAQPAFRLYIQGRQRLVEQEQVASGRETAGKGRTLVFPAGEAFRLAVQLIGDTGLSSCQPHPSGLIRLPPAFQRVGDVFIDASCAGKGPNPGKRC